MPDGDATVAREKKKRIRTTPYIPKIVVKLRNDFDLPYEDGVERYFAPQFDSRFDQNTVKQWQSIVNTFGALTLLRLITSVTPDQIKHGMEASLNNRWKPHYRPPNFLTYFFLRCPKEVDSALLVAALEGWPPVERAYVQSILAEPPGVIRSSEEILAHDYHGPEGVNAEHAWWFTGGDGAGQQFVDMEQGWVLDHEDLPDGQNPKTGMILDISSPPRRNEWDFHGHGTASLGVVLAVPGNAVPGSPAASGVQANPPSKDCVGIAPHVANAYVVCEVDVNPNDQWNHDRVNAIWTAHERLDPGGVLLLESHIPATAYPGYLPIEVESGVYDAIEACTQKGIIVIEPAGNGNANRNGDVNPILLGDSGAIMVASAYSWTVPTRIGCPQQFCRPPSTNYGTRINCFAWSDSVYTTGDCYQSTNTTDYNTYTGTSAASAMIAGAALILQGIAHANQLGNPSTATANWQYRFPPNRVRQLLGDPTRTAPANPATGNTLSGNSTYDPANINNWNADSIGVMPNMKAIIERLGLSQDLYIRDSTADNGLVPQTGILYASPDIILRSARFHAADPVQDQNLAQTALGEGSGTENSNTLGVAARAGQDNFIYVRVRNRGNAGAASVAVTLYWSEPATLVTPTLWQPPGGLTTIIPSVPAPVLASPAGILTVSPAITWPAGQIPASGHYCFVALVGNAVDPAPSYTSFLNWTDFEQFIRQNNNVAWRNFNVVDIQATASGIWAGSHRQPFSITGPHDRARDMRLEVIPRLPSQAKVMLQVPIEQHDLVEGMGTTEESEHGTQLVHLNTDRPTSSKYRRFPKDLRSKAHLLVRIPEEFHDEACEVSVRQLYEEREVGRITWRFMKT